MATTVRDDEEIITGEVMSGSTALMAVDRAAIDVQVATAKAYPRSVAQSLKDARALALLDPETAGTMFYALTRKENGKNKMIEGPSARLAEVMAYTWGNLRADADIVAEDATHITAMGTCFDLEKNVAVRVRVKRRIVDRNGRKFNADMIGVTGNAAISIALRNAVFKVIPRTFVDQLYNEAQQASLGQGGTLQQRRDKAMKVFAKLGVTAEEIFAALDVKGIEDVGDDELVTLTGFRNAIKDGEATVDSVFRPQPETPAKPDLNAKMDAQKDAGSEMQSAKQALKVKTEQQVVDAVDGVMETTDSLFDPE